MPKVYLLSEVDELDGDERLYVTDDPTGTPADGYVTPDTIREYVGDEPYNEVSATGSAESIDFDKPFQRFIMDEDCLFSAANKALSDEVKTTYVYITGAFTPSWSADFDWGDAGAPTYAEGSLFVFTSIDGETGIISGFSGGGFSV